MRSFPRSAEMEQRGSWKPWLHKGKPARVFFCCPDCGMVARLDHAIDENGVVTPSMVCPGDTCGFHEWIKLDGWDYGKRDLQQPPAGGEEGQ